jgi:hypothetical protein
MADLTTCLTIGGFSPEDAAEIRAFVRAAKGDQAAGIQAYLDSLQSDVADLAKQIDAKVNPGGPKKLAPVSIPRTLYQPAYHGTPHQFDKFSLDHIGTGEGAQAYGWGLYFAGRKGVAKFYRDKLTHGTVQFELDGQPVGSGWIANVALAISHEKVPLKDTDFASGSETYWYYSNAFKTDIVHAAMLMDTGRTEAATLADAFGEVVESRFKADQPYPDEDASARKLAEAFKGALGGVKTSTSGRLFKVDVPEDSELLVFDARLGNQPEAVQEKLAAIGFKVPDGAQERRDAIVNEMEAKSKDRDKSNRMVDEPGWHALSKERDALDLTLSLSGKAIYEMLAFKNGRGDDRSAGDKAASLALRDAGIPGHRYLDGGSRADGDGSYNYVIYDEAAVKVLEFEQQKRGSIVFPSGGLENGKTVINMFEIADLSTFLHETSHAFLEMFTALASTPDAPQQMQDDLATIRKWLGNDGGPYSVEQHEKYARGGEAYFMSGEAPSLALADAFSRFKAWLTRIYKTALGLNVKITPEIRDVMDRMLATDAEIAAARQEQEMRPLFSKAPPGMAAGDFATYQRMARRASEQAEQRLLEKTMEKVRREKESWFREEKKAVYAEVSSEFDRQPRYRLIDMLANQKWTGVDQKVSDMQIDRKMLVEQFGDGVLAEVSPQRLGGKRAIYGDSGSSPEEVAQFFGFGSASEMVSVLQNTQRKKGAIAQEVDRRMTERHGDPLTDGTIEREALEAIHNEQQANTAVSEARHMAKQLGRSASGMTVKLYRQRARLMVGRMAVKDVIRPERFLASERKAARAAQDAFAKVAKGGKNSEAALAAALQAKEQQILNGFLYNEARAVATEVQKGREKMRAYDKKSVREKLEGGYIEQIDAILSDYDFRVRGQGQINRAESLNAFIERMIAEGRESEISIDERLMDEAGRKHYTRLSVDELRGLFATIDNIDHMGRFKQRLKTASRQRMLDESASRVAGQIRAHKKLRKPKDGPRRGLQFIQLFADPDTIAIDLDGGEEFGAVYDEVLRDLNEGDARAEARQADAGAAIRKIFLNHYTKAEIRALGKEQNVAGAEWWTKEEILTLAMNMGNEDNFQRVMDQRVDQSRRMTPGILDALLSTLDERDWRFTLDMIKEVNGYFGELADVHKRQTDTSLKKVKAKVMTRIAPSWWTGGYYPISFDASVGGRKAEAYAEVTLQKQQTGGFTVANVKKGMTYERQSSAGGQTIRYSLSVPIAHVRDVIRVIELSEAVTATQRILRHDDVVRAFQETGTTEIKESLQLVVDAVANGPQFNNDWMNWAARTLKTNFTLAKLGLNLKTVTLQVTGLPQSAVVVGWGNLAKAMAKYFVSPARMASLASEVTSMSDVMNRRKMSFEKDLYEIRNQIETASPVKGRISEGRDIIAQVAMAPITILQFWIVDMPTWLAAYGKFKREGKSDFDAIHFADRLVERSQDSGRMPTRSQIELGSTSKRLQQSDLVRIFTTLGGYMFNKANRMRVEVLRAKYGMQGDASVAAKSAMALGHAANIFIMLTAEAVMMGALYAWMSDEDDDAEEMLGFVGKEAVGALTGGIPFVRDVYGKSQGFDAGLIGSVAGDVADVYTQTMQWEFDPALVRAYLNLTGDLTGLPTTAISRAVGFVMEPDETSPAEAFFGRNPLNR